MSNSLENILKSLNKEKVEALKKKAENGGLSELMQSVDPEKAKKMIADMGLSEKVKDIDISKLIETVKQNPELLRNLKNKL